MKLQKGLVVLFALLIAMGAWANGGAEKAAAPAVSNNAFLSDTMGIVNGSFLPNVPKPSKKWKIANITRTLMNAHWVHEKEGFLAACAHYGLSGDVFAVQTEQDVMQQANLLDTVVTKGYDAVVVSPISEKNLLPGLAKAAQKGIKIINVDTAKIQDADAQANGISIVTYIGSDNVQAGVMALEYIKSKLGDKPGKVACVEGRPGDTVAVDRTAGFVDTAKKYPNITVAASQSGQWDRLVALDVTTNMLRANPDIMGIYCNNDTMVLGALKAATGLGYKVLNSGNVDSEAGKPKTIIIIGNDGIAEALQAVQDGSLTGTIAQKPFLMGYSAVEAALQALEGQTASPRTVTPIKLLVQSDFQQ